MNVSLDDNHLDACDLVEIGALGIVNVTTFSAVAPFPIHTFYPHFLSMPITKVKFFSKYKVNNLIQPS